MRPILFSLAVLMLAVFSACGGDSETSDEGADQNPTTTAAAGGGGSAATPSGSGGGNGNGGTPTGDVDQLVVDLEPPNSAGILSESTADGILYISWETPESMDALRSFYDDAIAGAGYDVSSEGGAGVSYEWIFGPPGAPDFHGVLTISPGNGGSIVAAQLGSGS